MGIVSRRRQWRYSLVVRTGGFEQVRYLLTQVRSLVAPLCESTRELTISFKKCYNEDVRVVKETGLRSVGASLVGSIPTPRI